MNKRSIALLAATAASTIYAINHTIAKGLMPIYIEPFGFILLRVSGAALLFWIFSLALIFFGERQQFNAPNIPLGNLLFIVNAISYSIYLILVKSLTAKYSSITLMKWLFLFAFLMNLPIGIHEFMEVKWTSLPYVVMLEMAFVVVFTTVLTYLFNIYALRELKASTIGAFIYLQPVIAVIFAVLLGVDQFTPLRLIAALLIFTGVYLSSKKPKQF